MPLIQIVCSNCGYARKSNACALLQQRVTATCPKCQHVFVFDPDIAPRIEPPVALVRPIPASQPEEESVSLKGGMHNSANKRLLAIFLLLVLVSVGVRLWADSRFKAVPYPNLMAASADGIAVACGQSVYLYAPDGTLLRSYPFATDVHPTQLFWDKGSLCLADMKTKGVLVLGNQNELRKFRGATISAQFKVTREPATGHLFVSDGAGHRIIVFDETGRFLRSFGREGSEPGQFRFPNEMHFDESGQLLIANTKLPALEAYTPQGNFQGTLVTPEGDRTFRYPTDFAVTPDRLLVMENDGFLNRARVRAYDRKGARTAELSLGETEIIGDLVADGERLYLSDCSGRQVLAFSLAELRPLGPFSRDLAAKCAAWDREARAFKQISLRALVALLALCAPVIFFYLKMKRGEAKEISRVDVGQVSAAGNDVIMGVAPHAGKLRASLFLMGAGAVCVTLSALSSRMDLPPLPQLALLLAGLVLFLVGVILLIRSGGVADWKRKQTEQAFKRIVREKMLDLLPGERVEKVALAQHSQSANEVVLLIFTGRRLLLYDLSWNKVTQIQQLPYESITKVVPPGRAVAVMQQMQVVLTVEGKKQELDYYHQRADFLQLLCGEFSARMGRQSGLAYALLCLTCRQPLQGEYCATCATKLAPDRQAMWLSILFPGLGQIRNGQIQKGLAFCTLTVTFLLLGYVGINGWFFEGADLDLKQKFNLAVLVIMAPAWYITNVVDAYRTSIKGRKPL